MTFYEWAADQHLTGDEAAELAWNAALTEVLRLLRPAGASETTVGGLVVMLDEELRDLLTEDSEI